jgi:phosphatidate cytidylyltransferase
MNNTTTRIIVGLVGIPAVIGIVLLGGWFFFVFVQLIALVALYEFYNLADHKLVKSQRFVGYAASLLLGVYTAARGYFAPSWEAFLLYGIIALAVLVVLIGELWRNLASPLLNTAVTIFGVGYISLFMQALIELRTLFTQPSVQMFLQMFLKTHPEYTLKSADFWGAALVMCVFAGIWLCDSAAFFAGKAFGKHKLFPRVSPNKSWEGAVVGFLASALGFAVLAYFVLPFLPIVHAIILGALIGIVGQLGDLVESLLKRDAGIKDSSHLIPGHGGVYDRFDSVLFAAPLTYLYIKAFILLSSSL